MKKFQLDEFPKFYSYARRIIYAEERITGQGPSYDDIMIREGYKSAMRGEPGKGWVMSDVDFTWFVLRWL